MSFIIEICSVSDRDDLVAEIWWNGLMVAEVNRGCEGEFHVDVYSTESRKPWSFELSAWINVLNEAQRRLM